MNVLFLDDDPKRTALARNHLPGATCVETAEAAIVALRAGGVDVAFLDHDLSGETYVQSSRKDCGYEVVRELVHMVTVNPQLDRPLIVVHTYNDMAGIGMVHDLTAAGFVAFYAPFAMRGWQMAAHMVASSTAGTTRADLAARLRHYVIQK